MATPSLLLIPDRYKSGVLYSQLPESGAGDLDFTRGSTATRVNASGLIESVASGVPRLDYTGGGCPSLLLEPQRTNLFLQSNGFDAADWGKTNISVTSGQIGVNVANDAFLITENSANGGHILVQVPIVSGVHTVSVYAKAGTRDWIYLRGVQSGLNGRAFFNLSNGTIGALEGGATAKITPSVNGYYRCEMSVNHDVGFEFYIGITEADGVTDYVGNGTGNVFVANSQLEEGSYATSYIPTTTAAVTRLADTASKTGISSLIGQTEGTLFFDIARVYLDEARSITILWGGSGASYIQIFLTTEFSVIINGTLIMQGVTIAENTRYKLAVAYKSGSHAMYINGVQISVAASAIAPTVLNDYYLGNAFGAEQSGKYNAAALYPVRLSNTELASLTSL